MDSLKGQSRLAPFGKALMDPRLGCFQIGECRVIDESFQQTKPCLQESMPGEAVILVAKVGQHCHKPLVVIKDQHTFFVAAGANPHWLEVQARELGVERCTLNSTETAREFYLSRGYQEQIAPTNEACRSMAKALI